MIRVFANIRNFSRRQDMRRVRKLVVAAVGASVVLFGIALIVLPGPAFLVIPMGLAILATEFLWARRWLDRARALLPGGRKPRLAPPLPVASELFTPPFCGPQREPNVEIEPLRQTTGKGSQ